MQELPTKELTEKEAWIFLSKIFDNESLYSQKSYWEPVKGLCTAINEMYWNKLISFQLLFVMEEKLRIYRDRNNIQELYYWPNTIEGMKQRASFARLQADSISDTIPEKPE